MKLPRRRARYDSDKNYSDLLVDIVGERGSQMRGEVKTKAQAKVQSHYGLEGTKSEIESKVKKLLDRSTFIFGDVEMFLLESQFISLPQVNENYLKRRNRLRTKAVRKVMREDNWLSLSGKNSRDRRKSGAEVDQTGDGLDWRWTEAETEQTEQRSSGQSGDQVDSPTRQS
ncbi:hypothetical protein BD410DRAFT_801772 [Rickenella mellea]|uniref:DUF6532 domain-containing protein n=1 Tax=Rickenella mellea TaxID=50990 RepID=A0A4Y7QCU3_9AGAM|nr:hypothetical protein BD410DRAFT_801772 [Rickenella mellea]